VQVEPPALIGFDRLDATLPPTGGDGDTTENYVMTVGFTISDSHNWQKLTFTVVQDGKDDEDYTPIMSFKRTASTLGKIIFCLMLDLRNFLAKQFAYNGNAKFTPLIDAIK